MASQTTTPPPPLPQKEVDTVAKYEIFIVPPRWVFLRLETKNGVVGWGEPSLEGFSKTVAACVDELMQSVIGEDPTRIQYIYQKLYRQKFYAGGCVIMSAIAGIDQALYDISGKILNVPCHKLLGGDLRAKIKVYRWCGGDDNSPEEAANEAKMVISSSNYKQIKMNAIGRMGYLEGDEVVAQARERMARVREAVGEEVGIALDFHGRVKYPMVKKVMKALEPYSPLFFEEVVVPAQNQYFPALSQSTSIPLATGERMFTIDSFRDLLQGGGVGILQPDCSHVGGITGLMNIARLAEAYDVSLAPHCPLGPIALASCLMVDACCINFVFQETSMGIHYNVEGQTDLLDYVKNKEVLEVDKDGYIARLDGPGLGIEIDEEKVRHAAIQGHNWRDREWTLADGTPTTW